MLSLPFLVSTLLATVALAQAPNPSFNSSVIQQVIKEEDPTTLGSWCNGQVNSCGSLCGGKTDSNKCDPATLNYNCTCTSNHSSPALEYYDQTILSFVCHVALGDCLSDTAGSSSEQDECKQTIVCGSQNASTAVPATTSSAAPSSTGSPSATGSGSTASSTSNAGSPGSTPSHSAGNAVKISQEMATGVFSAALFALFGFAL